MNLKKKSWVEISRNKLLSNIATIRSCVGNNQKIGAMLKGNAYGHGILETLECIAHEVDLFCVIAPEDAINIHRYLLNNNIKGKRILVVGPVNETEIISLCDAGVEIAIADLGWESFISKLKKYSLKNKIKVHIYIDTGLGREGIANNDLSSLLFLERAKDLIDIVGVMTHFSNADIIGPPEYAKLQLENFYKGIDVLRSLISGSEKWQFHTSASSPSLLFQDAIGDFIRPGIGLYGHWTSPETEWSCKIKHQRSVMLMPALSWRCETQIIKRLNAGCATGYDLAYICQKPMTIGVLPIGYYDGYPYQASGKSYVLIKGKRCPILGNIMMNNIVVDLTDIEVSSSIEEQAVATLIGNDGDETITAEMVAKWSNSINYQVLTGIGDHLKRIIV
ncbi:MAG: alanine racemase [Pseudomonadota bacterium]